MAYASLKQLTALAAFVLANAPGLVFALSLDLPVACTLWQDCFIQNYVDVDPSPSYKDYRCGKLTYNGHTGTDFRILHLEMYKRGVPVIAAAPGKVLRVRDGMRDVSIRKTGVEAVKGREAGNAVIIEHGGGWTTSYAHMRRGSVAVKPGQEVKAGDHLGLVGMSGKTEFPHVHLRVSHNRRVVDPFLGLTKHMRCGMWGKPLWKPEALALMGYRPSGLLGAGFTDKKPDFNELELKPPKEQKLSARAPALIFWAGSWGLDQGDEEIIRLRAPNGAVLAQHRNEVKRHKAQKFIFVGKRLGRGVWLKGAYRGEYRVLRRVGSRKEEVVQADRTLQVF
jgi:hypothetical protein